MMKPLTRVLLAFPASAPADVVASGKRDLAGDPLLRLRHEPADVPPLHVQKDRREEQAVLRRNHRRSARVLDARELGEGNLRAFR